MWKRKNTEAEKRNTQVQALWRTALERYNGAGEWCGESGMNTIAQHTPSARIRFLHERVQQMMNYFARNTRAAEKEANLNALRICQDHLTHIDAALMNHKGMTDRLRACADRHGLVVADKPIEQVVIEALDTALRIIKTVPEQTGETANAQ